MSLLAQIRPDAEERVVEVNGRRFRVSFWDAHICAIRGVVAPDPLHPVEREPLFGMEIETAASFRASHNGGGNPLRVEVQNIAVVTSLQGNGWGSDMVRALMVAYPDATLEVSGPNEQSGPMFNKLAQQYPDRVSPSPRWDSAPRGGHS